MTWPLPNSDADVPSTDVSSGTAAGAPASARTSIFGPLITRFNTLKALVNTIINNGQPLTLNGSESATAFVNAAFGVKAGNAARADANTLDWYEEGTWTPVAKFGGGNTGMVMGQQSGKFTRVGNLVFYDLVCFWSNKGSSTGGLSISLPYDGGTAGPQTHSTSVTADDIASGVTLHQVRAYATGTNTLFFDDYNIAAGGLVQLTSSTFAAAHGSYGGITATGWYFTN